MNRFSAWLTSTCAVLLLTAVAGCREQEAVKSDTTAPQAEPQTQPQTAAELIREAHAALAVSAGMPAPLAPSSTRKERQEYLQGMAQPLAALLKLPEADNRNAPFDEDVPPEVFERCADLLAVELADAIDRDEPQRVARTLDAAFAYADQIGSRSVPMWVRANGLADRLCVGIRSVSGQVDNEIADKIQKELERISNWSVDPKPAIEFSERRVEQWRANAASRTQVDALLSTYATSLDGRQVLSPELANRIRSFAKDKGDANVLFAESLRPEVDVAANALLSFLRASTTDTNARITLPDGEKHPVALLFVLYLRPEIEMAPALTRLRLESVRLVSLTARVIASNFPKDLSPFGADSISPVNNLPFGYKVDGENFELVRPR